MSLKVGIGSSTKKETPQAAKEALALALKMLKDGIPDLVLIFSSFSAFDHKRLLKEIKEKLPNTPLVGCTTAGEIFNEQSLDQSLVLLALESKEVVFYPCVSEGLIKTPQKAAANLAKMIRNKVPNLKLLLLSGSSFATKGDLVLESLGGILGRELPIVGGNSGDDLTLKGGYVFYEDKIFNDALLGVALGGEISFGIGMAYGWNSIGVDMKITKIEGNRIYEINSQPARKVYEDYFGERLNELVNPAQVLSLLYPLGRERPDYPECLIRTPVAFYPDGSIEMGGAFEAGDRVKIMLGDSGSIIEAASSSARMAKERLSPKKTKVVLVFDCISRKRILGFGKRAEEMAALRDVFGKDAPLIGFYTYGEYAPLGGESKKSRVSYHNQSLVTLALGD